MKTFNFEFQAASAQPLSINILIDKRCYFSGNADDKLINLLIEYNETLTIRHVFELVIDGKRKLIDTLDDSDTVLEIKTLKFNDIDVLPMIKGKYIHNFNGFGEQTEEEFSTVVGCDGVLSFDFYTPLSYWISKGYPY